MLQPVVNVASCTRLTSGVYKESRSPDGPALRVTPLTVGVNPIIPGIVNVGSVWLHRLKTGTEASLQGLTVPGPANVHRVEPGVADKTELYTSGPEVAPNQTPGYAISVGSKCIFSPFGERKSNRCTSKPQSGDKCEVSAVPHTTIAVTLVVHCQGAWKQGDVQVRKPILHQSRTQDRPRVDGTNWRGNVAPDLRASPARAV